jgi:hypothetical protein
MNKAEEEFTLQLHPRPQEQVSLEMPIDTLESLKKVAASRDMSWEALLKFYIGQGLRKDLAKLFSDRGLEAIAQQKRSSPHPKSLE